MAEFVFIAVYIIANIIIAFSMVMSGKYVGELHYFYLNVDNAVIIFVLVITIIGYIITLYIYIMSKNNRKILINRHFDINKNRFGKVFTVIAVAQIMFLVTTGVGRVGSEAVSSISFIFSLLTLEPIFGLYYFLCRKSSKQQYIFNIILYVILKLLQGWTSVLFTIAMYELYFYFKKRKNTFVNILKGISLPVLLIFLGGKIYQFAYVFKNYIRYGIELNITYYEGIINLISRLAFFPISIGAYEKLEHIKILYFNDRVIFKEIQGLFRPFLPRFIMENKEFRALNNNVLQSFFPDITDKTSSNFGFLMYCKALFEIDWIEGLVWISMILFLTILIKRTLNSFEEYKGQLDFLYFILLLNIYNVASLEMVFGYGYFQLIYYIPFFVFIGVIKVKRGIKA